MRAFALAGIAALAASTAAAQSMTFDLNIEDFGDSSGAVADFDFSLGPVLSVDSVSIELSHSFASDIDFFLTASDGSVFVLMDENGGSQNMGDGGEDLEGLLTYTFVASSPNFIETSFADTNAIIAGGEYQAVSWQSGPFAAGTWNFFLGDDANLDDGAVGSITINYSVPTPGSMSLLAVAGLAAVRRRR